MGKKTKKITKPSKFKKVVDAIDLGHTTYKSIQGDPAHIYKLGETLLKRKEEKMPGGKPKRRFRRKRNSRIQRRYFNNYMRPVKIPVRASISWERTKGTTGKWSFKVLMQDLVKSFDSTYDEFKVLYLNLRWLPNNSTSSQGLCAAVLMDQDGFGEFGSASAASWFVTISTMPGSYVGNRHTSFVLRWKPTEPDAREWRSYQRGQTNYTVCHYYMADNGSEDSEAGGIILVSGMALGRGMFYNAATYSRNLAQRFRDEFEMIDSPPQFDEA